MNISAAPLKDHGLLKNGHPRHVRIKRNWKPSKSTQWSAVPASLHAAIRRILLREGLICDSQLLEQVRIMAPDEQPFSVDEAFEQLASYDAYGIHDSAPTFVRTQFSIEQLREIAHDVAYSWEIGAPRNEFEALTEDQAAELARVRDEMRTYRPGK